MKQITEKRYGKLRFALIATILCLIFVFAPSPPDTSAQNSLIHLHFKKSKTKRLSVRFKLINNLIVVPVFINGSDTMRFILDTGVSHTMITSLNGAPGISFNYAREIELFGMGSGREVKAFNSFGTYWNCPASRDSITISSF